MLLLELDEGEANKVRVSNKSWFNYLILLGYFIALICCSASADLPSRSYSGMHACMYVADPSHHRVPSPAWVGWLGGVGAQQAHALAQSGVTAVLDKQQARSIEAFNLFSQHSSY